MADLFKALESSRFRTHRDFVRAYTANYLTNRPSSSELEHHSSEEGSCDFYAFCVLRVKTPAGPFDATGQHLRCDIHPLRQRDKAAFSHGDSVQLTHSSVWP